MKKNKIIFLVCGLFLVLIVLLLFLYLFLYVKREGYPTYEAMYNRIISNGSIRITLPDNFPDIESATCTTSNKITFNSKDVFIYVGYTWCDVVIITKKVNGIKYKLNFNVQKLNNWNRVEYIPTSKNKWKRIDNGVPINHKDIIIEKMNYTRYKQRGI